MHIPFIDLQAQRKRISKEIDAAIAGVLSDGRFVGGPQVATFEQELAKFGQAKHAVACANGSDALLLAMQAMGVGVGDAVFCPGFTFAASAEMVPWLGATPVFVDILPDTYNLDPEHLEASIKMVLEQGDLTPKVVIPVDLFGLPADYDSIAIVARKYDMRIIADSAQSFGGSIDGDQPLRWADITTTSFFPAKPLGCYGDGGAILTNDDRIAEFILSARDHGKGEERYEHVRIGWNSRLDSMQAVILSEKLKIFPDEIKMRNRIAQRYSDELQEYVDRTPQIAPGFLSVWAQYTIECPDRTGLAAHLATKEVPTAIHYPKPLHHQLAYQNYPTGPGKLAVTVNKAANVISLPMHPYLDEAVQSYIIDAIKGYNRLSGL
ncbi:DegT/DnrJ/EryC1/StrS aminotransferase [hydrothermal vent metagenome]|uniref:DegT/DnrJ/EryC1/StrS aminotransferase n=1 Tax=hydrothermal vent metagenome TaxID=652676 RepID=A0A3B0S5R9_9ZZZZ